MSVLRSPIFPEEALTCTLALDSDGDALMPNLPESPTAKNSALEIYIVPTEDTLFVQGFKPAEYELRPPCLLRGLLVVRVLRSTRIRSIVLKFSGILQTNWPEGIPPKRNVYEETKDLVQHSWPFFQLESGHQGHDAHIYVPARRRSLELPPGGDVGAHGVSPTKAPELPGGFAGFIKRAASPRELSPSLTPVNSFTELYSGMLPGTDKNGMFAPGDYVYNFEHLVPALSPETVEATFGSVKYFLEATISRQGTFKPVLRGKLPITLIRVPLENSDGENEPIVIKRDWKDFLRYEIVVSSKAVVLDTYLPMSLTFIPLNGKVALHRIRVFITEECCYYCQGKKVQRSEPSRKFLLLEHKASRLLSLLSKDGLIADDATDSTIEVLPRELEFQMFVPCTINKKFNFQIHPDTAIGNIQCMHWIKICLRLLKPDPQVRGKRKHFEISIDSPIHLYSPLASRNNTLLPVYEREQEFLPQYTEDAPMSPNVTPIDVIHLPSQLSPCSLLALFIPRVASEISFQHVASATNIGYAEMDTDVHLDSNLYEPEEGTLGKIVALQAKALSTLASPACSPSSRPLMPTVKPPLFSSMGIAQNMLPPAYDFHHLSQAPPLTNDLLDRVPLTPVGQSIRDRLNDQLFKPVHKYCSSGQSCVSDASSARSKDKTDCSSTSDRSTKQTSIGNDSADASSVAADQEHVSVPDLEVDASSELPAPTNTRPGPTGTSADSVDLAGLDMRSRHSSVALSPYLTTFLDKLLIDQTSPLPAPSTASIYNLEGVG